MWLVNIDSNTDVEWISQVSNLTIFSSGIKINTNNYYTIFDIGIYQNDKAIDATDEGFYYGYNFIWDKIQLSPDFGLRLGYCYDTEQVEDFNAQLRATLSYSFNKWLGIYANAGINGGLHHLTDEDHRYADSDFIYSIGLKLF